MTKDLAAPENAEMGDCIFIKPDGFSELSERSAEFSEQKYSALLPRRCRSEARRHPLGCPHNEQQFGQI